MDWDVLYRGRGTGEVVAYRPIMTGDIFTGIEVIAPREAPKRRTIIVVEHPCSMRPDGLDLAPSLLVADVHPMKPIEPSEWEGRGRLMPLPDLMPEVASNRRHQVAEFTRTFHVHRDDLELDKRMACLSPRGVILLFQRWVFFSSRCGASDDFNAVVLPVYEEIDLAEDWCEAALAGGRTLGDAWLDVNAWLSRDAGETTRRQALEDPQKVAESVASPVWRRANMRARRSSPWSRILSRPPKRKAPTKAAEDTSHPRPGSNLPFRTERGTVLPHTGGRLQRYWRRDRLRAFGRRLVDSEA